MSSYKKFLRLFAAAATVALIGIGGAACGAAKPYETLDTQARSGIAEASAALTSASWMQNFNPCEPAEFENTDRLIQRLGEVLAACDDSVVNKGELASFRKTINANRDCFLDSLYWVCHRAVPEHRTVAD